MIVTGAFLAEAVSVADGKLFVLGGVLSSCTRLPGQGIGMPVVVLTQADDSRIEVLPVTIYRPDGSEIQTDGFAIPEVTQSGHDAGFLVGGIGLAPEEPDGRYVIVVGDRSLPLTLDTST